MEKQKQCQKMEVIKKVISIVSCTFLALATEEPIMIGLVNSFRLIDPLMRILNCFILPVILSSSWKFFVFL